MAMTKEERRKLMPMTSAVVDDLREHFGPEAGIWAEEGGEKVVWPGPKPEFVEVAAHLSQWETRGRT